MLKEFFRRLAESVWAFIVGGAMTFLALVFRDPFWQVFLIGCGVGGASILLVQLFSRWHQQDQGKLIYSDIFSAIHGMDTLTSGKSKVSPVFVSWWGSLNRQVVAFNKNPVRADGEWLARWIWEISNQLEESASLEQKQVIGEIRTRIKHLIQP